MNINKSKKIYLDFLINRCLEVDEKSGLRGLFRQIKNFKNLVLENLDLIGNKNYAKKWTIGIFSCGIGLGIGFCLLFSGAVLLLRRKKDNKVSFLKLILEFIFPSLITGLGFTIIYILKKYSFVDLSIFIPSIILAAIIILIVSAIDFSSFLKASPDED